MLDVDPEKRRKNLAHVQERLAVAELLGARNCVDIAGSYNPHSLVRPRSQEHYGGVY